jgi:hypothetical protein
VVDSNSRKLTCMDGPWRRLLWELVTDGGKMVTLQQIADGYLQKGQWVAGVNPGFMRKVSELPRLRCGDLRRCCVCWYLETGQRLEMCLVWD